MKPLVKIEELFDINQVCVENVGLFTFLANYDDGHGNLIFPDIQDFINSSNCWTFDYDFFVGYSAEKYFSPLLMKFIKRACDNEGIDYGKFLLGTLSDLEKKTIIVHLFESDGIGHIIYTRFVPKWKHIWDALNITYNPLENYSMEETRTPNITKQIDGDGETTTTSDSGIQGFNSVESNPSSDVNGHQEDEISRTETETGTETVERSGNIGVTTSQQMLQSEFEVRKFDFYKMIYEDVDSILCLLSY